MHRRDFLKRSSLLAAGGLLMPSFLSSCSKESQLKKYDFQGSVIIIGAGAAGLYAAYALKESGVTNIQVLEASAVHGGRLRKDDTFLDFPIDIGAQWIQGPKALTGKLARQTDEEIYRDNMGYKIWYNNQLTDDAFPDQAQEMMTTLRTGGPNDFDDVSMQAYLDQQGIPQDMYHILDTVAGEAGTSMDRLALREWARQNREWNAGGKSFLFKRTYYDLINDHIASQVLDKISYNVVVNRIDYTNDMIEVRDTQGNTYTAEKVIITVPIPILRDGDIEFVPALPAEQTAAFSQIGMGRGMKIFMKFSEEFYGGYTIGGEKSPSYVNANFNKGGNDNALFAFAMGTRADYLASLSQAQLQAELLAELDLMYNGQASASFIDMLAHDWMDDPYVRGAYSYAMVGAGNTLTVRETASRSVDQKLYFAGEAFSLNTPATVQGAAQSGCDQVLQLLEDAEN